MVHLALSLLGPFQARLDGHPTEGLSSDRLRGLLAYLAVESGREHTREQVAALLWPERSDREALRALRFALSRLLTALDDRRSSTPFVLVSRTTVQFNQDSDHQLDIVTFESLAASHDVQSLERAIALYRGPFLEGLSAGESPALEDWLLLKTEAYRWAMLAVLGDLTALQIAQGAYANAVRWARRQLEIEPYRELAHRQLMTALALGGDRTTALVAYEACRRLLMQELGCEPEDETQALSARIREGTLTAPHLPPALLQVPQPSGSDAASSRSPIVAREQELSRLNALLVRALGGRGALALVVGEAGSGKTALLDAHARRAEQANPDLIVLRGSCNTHGGAGDPYLPFSEILQTLAGDVEGKRAGGTLSQEQVRRVWEALPVTGTALVTHGPNLLDSLVPGRAMLRRAEGFPLPGGGGHWKTQLRELVSRAEAQLADNATALPVRTSRTSQRPGPQVDLFAQVTQVFHAVSQSRPLLLLIDDLQWADSGTAALLFHLGRRLGGSRLLIACACRPEALDCTEREEEPSQVADSTASSIGAVLNELCREWGNEIIDLDQVDGRAFVEAYVDAMPNQLDGDFRQTLYEHTDGNPLFTVELLRSFERDGTLVQDESGRWVEGGPLHWERWPPEVEAVIAGHMAGLTREERSLLQAASVQGETFVAEVAARVLGRREEEVLRKLSGSLRTRHRLVEAVSLDRLSTTGQRLSRYRFRHILLQMSAYESLDAIRRAVLHEATARALEAIYETEAPGRLPTSKLAHHFEMARMPLEAARYRLEAGRWAVRLVAYDEAIAHLEQGLALLDRIPPSRERLHVELGLCLALGTPLMLQRGWQGTVQAQVLERLSDLTQNPELEHDPQRLAALTVLALTTGWSANPERSERVGKQLLSLAQDGDRETLMLAHWALGLSHWLQGQFPTAREHLEQALVLYNPESSRPLGAMVIADPGVMAHAMLGAVIWQMGYPDQGRATLEQAVRRAEALEHPSSVAFAHYVATMLITAIGRDVAAALPHGQAMASLGQVSLVYGVWTKLLTGLAQVRDGKDGVDAAASVLEREVTHAVEAGATWQSAGSGAGYAGLLMLQAEVCVRAGKTDTGLIATQRAQAWVEQSGVRAMAAEVWRMQGELLLAWDGQRQTTDQGRQLKDDGKTVPSATLPSSPRDEAESYFLRALEIARSQGGRLLELRAASSLARLWKAQGRAGEALDLLSPIYAWFTEGFDCVDLREAQAMLHELKCPANASRHQGIGS